MIGEASKILRKSCVHVRFWSSMQMIPEEKAAWPWDSVVDNPCTLYAEKRGKRNSS